MRISSRCSALLQRFESNHLTLLPARFKSSITARRKCKNSSPKHKTQSKGSDSPSIYHAIKEIVGTDDPIPKVSDCTLNDRRIAQEKQLRLFDSHDTHPNVSEDVSPVVHKIAEAIRLKGNGDGMEERLEKLGVLFTPEIVEKVLKRCFKVGNLALMFFYWVKLKPGYVHATECYNTMIYIACEAKDFDLVENLLCQMDGEFCPRNIKTWTILISHYGKAKKIGKALLIFQEMKKSGIVPDKGAYEAMLRALLNVEKTDLAFEFYKEIVSKNITIHVQLNQMLMMSLLRSGDLESVRLVRDDMLKIAQVPENEVYVYVLRSFCITGAVQQARDLFTEIKHKNMNIAVHAYEIVLKGFCRAGKLDDALEIVDEMRQNFVVVDSKIYACLIDGFLRVGDIERALEILHDMQKFRCLPMVSSYTQIIQHLFRSNQYEKACEIYEEMIKTGIEPDLVAITAMVAGHVQHDHIARAIDLFDSIMKKGIRLTWKSCSVIIKELCKASKPEEALRILKEMSTSNMNATKDIYRLIILSLNRKGDFDRAREVERMSRFFQIRSKEEIPSSDCGHHCTGQDYSRESFNLGIKNHLFVSITRKDGSDKAEQVEQLNFQETNSTETVITFNEIDHERVCRILSSSMEWSSMQELLETSNVDFTPELVESVLWKCRGHGHASLKFFSWIRQRSGYKNTTEAYNMAIKIAGAAKDFKHMRDLYRDMKRFDCSITINTWNIMIAQYGQAGLTEIALKIFKEMEEEGYKPNASTYKYLIIFLCGNKGRKIDDAIKCFQEMVHSGYMPDRELLHIYLSSLCELGNSAEARRSVNSLCERGLIPQLGYSLLSRALCRAGKIEEALILANNVENLGCKMDHHIYASIIHALLRGGRSDEALDMLDMMRKLGISETVHIYTSLIVHFCKEKDIGKAKDTFRKMREEGCEPTVVTYSALIRGLMNVGMVSDAWNVFYRMKLKGPFPDFMTYSMFIACLCKDGRSEEGMKLIHDMIDNGIIPSAVNFRVVFHGLNREGKQDLAHSVLQSKSLLNRRRKFSF